jgi:uncharacterized protein YjbJ (UPF0337 family)
MNQQTLQGNWNEISGKLRSKWGQLANDDLEKYKGDTSQLVGMIQRKTGEARDKIQAYLDDLSEEGAHGMSRTMEAVGTYATQAMDSAREGAETVAEKMREGYESAEKTLQNRPVQSAALAFGAGLVAGVLLSVIMRSDR